MIESSKAVFLSYASQDAEPARRICYALRAAGIEVWFDQSELRGGDAWDRQIRKQIHDCALFMPIISAITQARLEGYFRREWKLAVDRTHDMADAKPFLVPVVIDDTTDQEAEVPESFRAVQWTRLREGETPPAFVERISRLMSAVPSLAAAKTRQLAAASPSSVVTPFKPRARASWRSHRVVFLIAAVGLVAAGYFAMDRFVLSWRVASMRHPSAQPAHDVVQVRSAVPEKSIAVLPFVDMSEKHDEEYFSDGLSDELIDVLAQVPDLQVIARTSSFAFKGTSEDIPTIAKKLNVSHVLEGSVRKSGSRLRITAQLVRATTGVHLWSHSYDRKIEDIFKIQDEIALAVVNALKIQLTSPHLGDSSRTTPNSEAHRQFLLGIAQWYSLDSSADQRALPYFRRAVELDPSYALAYCYLGFAKSKVSGKEPEAERAAMREALADLDKAVNLAPDLAEAYAIRGRVRFQVLDIQGATGDIAKATALGPGEAGVLRRVAIPLARLGRAQEGIDFFRKSQTLDPVGAWASSTDLVVMLVYAHAYADARHELEVILKEEPTNDSALLWLAVLNLLEGRTQEALLSAARKPDEKYQLAIIAMAQSALHDPRESQRALEELITKYGNEIPGTVADVYAWRNEKDHAFEWLERAYDQRDGGISDAKVDPFLANLHGDPRFAAFLRKMNLP